MFSPGVLSQSIFGLSSVDSVPSTRSGRSLKVLNSYFEGKPIIRLLRRSVSIMTAVIESILLSDLVFISSNTKVASRTARLAVIAVKP